MANKHRSARPNLQVDHQLAGRPLDGWPHSAASQGLHERAALRCDVASRGMPWRCAPGTWIWVSVLCGAALLPLRTTTAQTHGDYNYIPDAPYRPDYTDYERARLRREREKRQERRRLIEAKRRSISAQMSQVRDVATTLGKQDAMLKGQIEAVEQKVIHLDEEWAQAHQNKLMAQKRKRDLRRSLRYELTRDRAGEGSRPIRLESRSGANEVQQQQIVEALAAEVQAMADVLNQDEQRIPAGEKSLRITPERAKWRGARLRQEQADALLPEGLEPEDASSLSETAMELGAARDEPQVDPEELARALDEFGDEEGSVGGSKPARAMFDKTSERYKDGQGKDATAADRPPSLADDVLKRTREQFDEMTLKEEREAVGEALSSVRRAARMASMADQLTGGKGLEIPKLMRGVDKHLGRVNALAHVCHLLT